MDNVHFTINHLLPYQRNFNLVNAIRGVGKTYSPYYYFIKRWLDKGEQFVTICRTQDEKKNGFIRKGVEKVILREYPELLKARTKKDKPMLTFNKDSMMYGGEIVGHCIALSEYVKVKRNAYPLVKWGLFDEYVIEEDNPTQHYIKGFDEPDLLLSIYDTIDRREDRLIMFLMGNNISAYNPYHMHKAFRIPYTEPGKIFKRENVLFENYVPSEELKEVVLDCKFARMVEGTTYGDMATKGKYIYDSEDLIVKLNPAECVYHYTILFNKAKYGVWRSSKYGCIISDVINPTCREIVAVRREDITDNTRLLSVSNGRDMYVRTMFRCGKLTFSNMECKKRFTEILVYF